MARDLPVEDNSHETLALTAVASLITSLKEEVEVASTTSDLTMGTRVEEACRTSVVAGHLAGIAEAVLMEVTVAQVAGIIWTVTEMAIRVCTSSHVGIPAHDGEEVIVGTTRMMVAGTG